MLPTCLNTLLDDSSYRTWLIQCVAEADMMLDYSTPLAEAIAEDPEEFSVKSVERHLCRQYAGGMTEIIQINEVV